MKHGKSICPYCNKLILKDEPSVIEYGEKYHIGCAIAEADGNDLDNERG